MKVYTQDNTFYKITWNGKVVQIKQLVTHKCQAKGQYFTTNSPIYQAIENKTFMIDLGYGQHYFKVEEV